MNTAAAMTPRPEPRRHRRRNAALTEDLIRRRVPASLCAPRRAPALTARQAEVVAFVAAFRDEYGVAPTYRDVMARFGWTGTNSVRDHYDLIEKKGYIDRHAEGAARSVRLTPLGEWWWSQEQQRQGAGRDQA